VVSVETRWPTKLSPKGRDVVYAAAFALALSIDGMSRRPAAARLTRSVRGGMDVILGKGPLNSIRGWLLNMINY